MHIAEGYLPAAHCAAWALASAPFVVHGAREVVRRVESDPRERLLLGAAGAMTFVLSAIKLPSLSGSSSHPTGTGFGAVLFRPPVMACLSTIVLVFQALLLAHGGLSTLGANVFSMGVVGPWIGYAAYRLLRGVSMPVAVFAAMACADLATYLVTTTQLALAYPDAVSGFAGAWAKFAAVFAVSQIPVAIVEGLFGVLVFRALARSAAPELRRLGVEVPSPATPPGSTPPPDERAEAAAATATASEVLR